MVYFSDFYSQRQNYSHRFERVHAPSLPHQTSEEEGGKIPHEETN